MLSVHLLRLCWRFWKPFYFFSFWKLNVSWSLCVVAPLTLLFACQLSLEAEKTLQLIIFKINCNESCFIDTAFGLQGNWWISMHFLSLLTSLTEWYALWCSVFLAKSTKGSIFQSVPSQVSFRRFPFKPSSIQWNHHTFLTLLPKGTFATMWNWNSSHCYIV